MAITDTQIPSEWTQFSQEDRATFDFLKNVKTVSMAVVGKDAKARYQTAMEMPDAPGDMIAIGRLINPTFAWQADRFVSRQAQEMLWPRLFEALGKDEEQFLQELDGSIENPVGSLRLNPEVPVPSYYEVDYHLQPGGMHGKAMIPWVMEVGKAVYHSGANDRWDQQYRIAGAIPDGRYGRILDLGCGMGHSVIPIKERFPEAEVYGIDMSAPFLKYAHRLAERFGVALQLSQQNAERTDFPDSSFDVVSTCILFHEIPDEAARNVIREVHRILKPGGIFNLGDIGPYRRLDPYQAFFSDWQTENNGEPYWRQHGQRNLPAMMLEAGFAEATETPLTPGGIIWIFRGVK